jgi:hypothetical protein
LSGRNPHSHLHLHPLLSPGKMYRSGISHPLQLQAVQPHKPTCPPQPKHSRAIRQRVLISKFRLQADSIEPISRYPKLYELALDNNLLEDFNWTRFLKRNRITVLSLKGNPIAEESDYRERIFKGLGSDLEVLDGMDRAGNAIFDN